MARKWSATIIDGVWRLCGAWSFSPWWQCTSLPPVMAKIDGQKCRLRVLSKTHFGFGHFQAITHAFRPKYGRNQNLGVLTTQVVARGCSKVVDLALKLWFSNSGLKPLDICWISSCSVSNLYFEVENWTETAKNPGVVLTRGRKAVGGCRPFFALKTGQAIRRAGAGSWIRCSYCCKKP